MEISATGLDFCFETRKSELGPSYCNSIRLFCASQFGYLLVTMISRLVVDEPSTIIPDNKSSCYTRVSLPICSRHMTYYFPKPGIKYRHTQQSAVLRNQGEEQK